MTERRSEADAQALPIPALRLLAGRRTDRHADDQRHSTNTPANDRTRVSANTRRSGAARLPWLSASVFRQSVTMCAVRGNGKCHCSVWRQLNVAVSTFCGAAECVT
jgi:hypothetical protein